MSKLVYFSSFTIPDDKVYLHKTELNRNPGDPENKMLRCGTLGAPRFSLAPKAVVHGLSYPRTYKAP